MGLDQAATATTTHVVTTGARQLGAAFGFDAAPPQTLHFFDLGAGVGKLVAQMFIEFPAVNRSKPRMPFPILILLLLPLLLLLPVQTITVIVTLNPTINCDPGPVLAPNSNPKPYPRHRHRTRRRTTRSRSQGTDRPVFVVWRRCRDAS